MKTKTGFSSLFPLVLILTAVSAAAGLFIDSIYSRELAFMSIKSQSNDVVLLFIIVPTGFLLYALIRRKNLWSKVFAAGLLVYLLFFIGFNAFNLQFNLLFLLYIAVISISFLILLKEIPDLLKSINSLSKLPQKRLISIVMLFISITGYGFWLSEVIPALISDTKPDSIIDLNLPVNAATVFDLAFMLPLMILGAIKLWRGEISGMVISGLMLSWLVLTSISVVSMEIGLKLAGMEYDLGKIISVSFNGVLGLSMILILVRKAEFD